MNKRHASLIHRMLLINDVAANGSDPAKVAMQQIMEKHSAYKAALFLLSMSKTLEYAAEELIDYKDDNTLEDGSNAELDKRLSGWTKMLVAIIQELDDFMERDSTDNPSPLNMDWLVGE